jgi:dUTP pyrophosphatase
LKVKLLNSDAILPTKAHETDAGFDIYIPHTFKLDPIYLKCYVSCIDTGIAVEVPDGKFCLIKERSSLALRGMVITAGVIDYGYRGEIKIICHNVSGGPIQFYAGDKIAQLLVLPFYNNKAEEVDDVSKTKRGDRGFGSSGK